MSGQPAAHDATDGPLWCALGIAATLIAGAMLAYQWTIVWRSIGILTGATAAVVAIGAFYHVSGRSASLARLGFALGLLMTLAMVGQSMTYVLAPLGGAMRDDWLRAADHAFGFDWAVWADWLAQRPRLNRLLDWWYPWHVAEAWVAVTWLSFAAPESARAFLRALFVTLVVSACIMVPLPALGEALTAPHVAQVTQLRDGSFHTFDLMRTEGLISMPSYHAILGTLVPLACWPTRARWVVVVFNMGMLVATVHTGAHYLVDVIAGVSLAIGAAWVTGMSALRGNAGSAWHRF